MIVSPATRKRTAAAAACMSAASVGLSVGAGAGSLPTHLLPPSYRTSSKPPSPLETRPPLFPLLSRWDFFCGRSLCQARLCRFHPRVYGDTRSPQWVRFLEQTRPSECQQTTDSPRSVSLHPQFHLQSHFPKHIITINIRSGHISFGHMLINLPKKWFSLEPNICTK